jgi:ATP phosphoribosyltransferase regulatory subunit HisZ
VRPLLIEAAARRKRIEQRFVERLDAAGFSEVILPILDYVDAYAALNGPEANRRTYRFTDRDGELVALRSDFTPIVARALAPSIDDGTLPLRVYYRGDVIRCDRSRLGAHREMFQIGAEIIGDASLDCDVEVLSVAATLAGDATVFYTDASRDRLAQLESRLDGRFRLDAADPEEGTYYTGLRFAVYENASGNRIAQGGRYDTLYERFGAAAPAIGFTFTIDDLD